MAKRKKNRKEEDLSKKQVKKLTKKVEAGKGQKYAAKIGASKSAVKSIKKSASKPKPQAKPKSNKLKNIKAVSKETYKGLKKGQRKEIRSVAKAYARRGASAKKILKKVPTTRKIAKKLDRKFDKGDYKKTKKIKDKQPGVGHFKMIKKKDPNRKKDKKAIKGFKDSNLADKLKSLATRNQTKPEETAPTGFKPSNSLDRMREETSALEEAAGMSEPESSNNAVTQSSVEQNELFPGVEGGAGTLAGTSATGIQARRSRRFRQGLTSRGTMQLNRSMLIGTGGMFGL